MDYNNLFKDSKSFIIKSLQPAPPLCGVFAACPAAAESLRDS